jgi:hypothetical protein
MCTSASGSPAALMLTMRPVPLSWLNSACNPLMT